MRINHILFKTNDIEQMIRFLVDVIGLKTGYRPPFRFPGAWIYSGDIALFHLVEAAHDKKDTGNIDHVAIEGGDYEGLLGRLTKNNAAFNEVVVPETRQRQVFVSGPDGLNIEMLFEPE